MEKGKGIPKESEVENQKMVQAKAMTVTTCGKNVEGVMRNKIKDGLNEKQVEQRRAIGGLSLLVYHETPPNSTLLPDSCPF